MLLKHNNTGNKSKYKTLLSYKKGKRFLTFKFSAFDSKFYCPYDKYNEKLFDGDVCEIFITYGKKDHYYEIEVAPNGATFLGDIVNPDRSPQLTLLKDCFIKTSSKKIFNNYFVRIQIPLDKLGKDEIYFNAFRIEHNGDKNNYYLISLSPTLCESFHVRDKFIKL